jgi:hypothetical protein
VPKHFFYIHSSQESSCQLARECVCVGQTTEKYSYLVYIYFTIWYMITMIQISLSSWNVNIWVWIGVRKSLPFQWF